MQPMLHMSIAGVYCNIISEKWELENVYREKESETAKDTWKYGEVHYIVFFFI